MNLRDRVRELANSKGMSLPNLEAELGFGNSTIVKWDKSIPNVDKLSRVANYFNVSLDYLTGKTNFKKGIERYSSFCTVNDAYFEDVFDFGALIGRERKSQGISIKEMSASLGLTENDLEEIEEGILPINEEWAKKMTAYLGTTISQLLFDYGLYDGDIPQKYHDRIDEWERLQNKIDEEGQNETWGNDGQLYHSIDVTYEEHSHLCKYRSIDEKGKHTVDTVLKMEYERCKPTNIVPINKPEEEKAHRIPKASHERTDIEVTDEMRQHDDDIMNDPDF